MASGSLRTLLASAREQLRLRLRWAAMHGFIRVLAARAATRGDPQARLIADPAVKADPLPVYAELRAAGPLVSTMISSMTVEHDIVHETLRSDDFRSIVLGSRLPGPLRLIDSLTRSQTLHPLRPPSLLAVEPPEHTGYRKLVSSVFTARAVAGMRDNVQLVADRLLDELSTETGPVDIIERYCAQLPVAVIGDILGVPDADRPAVLAFGEAAAPSLDIGLTWAQFQMVESGLRTFDEWLTDHIATLRRHPGDDLMSQLIHATEDGVGLSDTELRGIAGLVLAAGFETTVNILGSGIEQFVRHPDQLAVLEADPSWWPNAADELLRLQAPVQLTARVARRAVTVRGHHFQAGEVMVLVLAGANRDPKVFDDPDRFDVTRANAARHLSFSGGRHFCLGAALARAETEVGLRSLFDRFPDLSLAGGGVRRDTRVLNGWASLPVHLGRSTDQRAVS
ncbi:cytochrome P450 [Williamsia sp. CHRR-6]|uniref:cytochrome P450 n=1 Tax=Williamsia sp. CHRR-6 TaxID=2835871 RepID=UPI001BDA1369|nr:cytochrome P450 [Williamsia sp. CHRR-6]MBT0568159.1 cytochrome P450 [Williamsia sp. CHRR-6]